MASPDKIKKIQLFLSIEKIPFCPFVIKTITQAMSTTTQVLTAVARLELTPSIPIFARIEVAAAKTEDKSEKISHIETSPALITYFFQTSIGSFVIFHNQSFIKSHGVILLPPAMEIFSFISQPHLK